MLTYVAMRVLLVVWAMFGSGFGHAPRHSFKKLGPSKFSPVSIRMLPVVWAIFGLVYMRGRN